jgi:hypothetical protein
MKSVLCIMFSLALFTFHSECAKSQVINYPWPESASKSPYYSVKVYYENEEHGIFTHLSEPNTNADPVYPNEGHGVTAFMLDRSLSFAQFAFEGEITVEVTKLFGNPARRVEISPKAFGINPTYFDGKKVRFNLKQDNEIPRYISVNFDSNDNKDDDRYGGNNIRNGMMIFADKPEQYIPSEEENGVVAYSETANLDNASIILFKAGEYDLRDRFNTISGQIGQMPVKSGQKIYLEGGAIVHGAFRANRNNNIWIFGRGIITGQKYAWHWFRDANGRKDAFINLLGSDNCIIEGVIIENPTHHTIPSGEKTIIKNLKILGWASNHDGIRPSSGSVADGIFIKTSDDYDYARSPHVVKNSIFWPMVNGAVGMMGWNDLGTGYAEYYNNFIINSEWSVPWPTKGNTGVMCGSKANGGIKLQENIVEDLVIENYTNYLVNSAIEEDGPFGYLRNFRFKNIKVEYPFQTPNKTMTPQIMRGRANNWIEGWTFTNLVVDGVLVTWDNYKDYFDLDLSGNNGNNTEDAKFVRNILFNSEGEIHQVTVTANEGGSFFPKGNQGRIDIPEGTGQTVSIIPSPGFRIVDVRINGESNGRQQSVVFENITSDQTLEIEFEEGDDFFGEGYTGRTVDRHEDAAYHLFPNPATSYIKIDYCDTKELQIIEIMSVEGRIVKTFKPNRNTENISLSLDGLPPGLYVFNLKTPEGNFREKIMIQQ